MARIGFSDLATDRGLKRNKPGRSALMLANPPDYDPPMSVQSLPLTPAPEMPTVLLVEDDVLVRMVTAGEMRAAGLTVIEAASAQEAYDALAAGLVVDIVFSDVRTGGALDGYELARRLGTERPNLPVILTSGHFEQAVAVRVAPFLTKPYRMESVLQLIQAQLRREGAE